MAYLARIWCFYVFYGLCCLIQIKWKKRSERRKHCALAACSKAEPKIFASPQNHFPGAQDGQNLISWRWLLPLHTNPVWWGSMHAISSYRGKRPTNKHTHKHTNSHTQTHRQDRLQYTAPQPDSAQCNKQHLAQKGSWCRCRKIL